MGEAFPSSKATSGGGYIYMNVESIHLTGDGTRAQIQAEGYPADRSEAGASYSKFGGSGGYIQIVTKNNYSDNNLFNNAYISANGGTGRVAGFGGAGGVIILDGKFAYNGKMYARAYGGLPGDTIKAQ